MNKYIVAILIFLTLAGMAIASGKYSLDLGIAGVGARPMGMGRTFTAVADDTNALFQNPGGLALLKTWGVTSMTTKVLRKADYRLLGSVLPTEFGTFGLGYVGMNTPAGYLTTDRASLASATPISYNSSFLYLSYGYDMSKSFKTSSLGKMGVGCNIKMINDSFNGVAGATATGVEADLGLLIKSEKANFGITLTNAGSGGNVSWKSGTKEDVPSVIKLGLSFNPLSNLLVAIDAENSTIKQPMLMHGGVEWSPMSVLALRAGLDQEPSGASSAVTNITAGLGVNLSGFRFDYAYRSDALQNANSNHYISISYMPELPVKEAEKVAQAEQSPAPEAKKVRSYQEIIDEHKATHPDESVKPAEEKPVVAEKKKVRSYDEIMADYKATHPDE